MEKMSFCTQTISLLLFGIVLVNGQVMLSDHVDIMSDAMIDEINQLGTTWKVKSINEKKKIQKICHVYIKGWP